MRAMHIDFVRAAPLPRVGWVLLIAGFALTGVAADQAMRFREQQDAWNQAQDKAAQQVAEKERQRLAALPLPMPSYEDDKRWRRAATELALPWLGTLRAIEHATKPPVFLVGFKAEPVSGRLQLEAESPDLDAALAYVATLQAESQLANTQLVSHQQVSDSQGQMQLRISLQTQWVSER